jgi:hypothetical protein
MVQRKNCETNKLANNDTARSVAHDDDDDDDDD